MTIASTIIAVKVEPLSKRKVDEEAKAETWTPSYKRSEMNASREYISLKIDVSKPLDADINFPKIHLMSHRVQPIRQYGALQQYAAERHEQAHKRNLMDGWNASNHNPNCLLQVITFQRHILCFEIRELNL